MSSSPLKFAIHGAAGRMGIRLVQLIQQSPDLTLAAAIDRPGHPSAGRDVGELTGLGTTGVVLTDRLNADADALIDFSTPEAALRIAEVCRERSIPLVVGTTGFEPAERERLDAVGDAIPLLVASNFSKAVNLLMHLSAEAARAIGHEADIEIVERHHRFKKDAPSGTALRLADGIAEAVGVGRDRYVYGREGLTGERPRGDIGLHALRTGDNPGEHTVVFGLMGECVELSHRALNRDGFVLGALDAARFLAGKPPGRYAMRDLLGF